MKINKFTFEYLPTKHVKCKYTMEWFDRMFSTYIAYRKYVLPCSVYNANQ